MKGKEGSVQEETSSSSSPSMFLGSVLSSYLAHAIIKEQSVPRYSFRRTQHFEERVRSLLGVCGRGVAWRQSWSWRLVVPLSGQRR